MGEQARESTGEKEKRGDSDHLQAPGLDVGEAKQEGGDAAGKAADAAGKQAAGESGPVELPRDVRAKLESSFGELPAFEVVVDATKVPEGARAASDKTHLYLKERGALEDLELIAHEVAHIIQQNGGPKKGAGSAAEAEEEVAPDGAVDAAAKEAADETGQERQSLEEVADEAAASVESGEKVAEMASTPVTEGETYLKEDLNKKIAAKSVKLVLFPGEGVDEDGTTIGTLYVYVNGKMVKSYPAVGGPAPGMGSKGDGGHSAGVTPAGDYTLDRAEHHTTKNWPNSVVPWGAKIRERADGEIEYSGDEGKSWQTGTGKNGTVTASLILWVERTRASEAAQARAEGKKGAQPAPITDEDRESLGQQAREVFKSDDTGALLETYDKNDFGNFSFNMTRDGGRSAYYVHTTPVDEKATAENKDVKLAQSHGCVHIRPADREEMQRIGYLQKGVKMTVKKYGQKGP